VFAFIHSLSSSGIEVSLTNKGNVSRLNKMPQTGQNKILPILFSPVHMYIPMIAFNF
jgi:hypothetical protein